MKHFAAQARQAFDRGNFLYGAKQLWWLLNDRQDDTAWTIPWIKFVEKHYHDDQALIHDFVRPWASALFAGLAGGRSIKLVTRRCHLNRDPLSQPTGMVLGTEAWLRTASPSLQRCGAVQYMPNHGTTEAVFKEALFRLRRPGTTPLVCIDDDPEMVTLHHRVLTERGLKPVSIWVPDGPRQPNQKLPADVLVLVNEEPAEEKAEMPRLPATRGSVAEEVQVSL
ncbi:antitoxin MazE-like protein [Patescibacteria group bacterium]